MDNIKIDSQENNAPFFSFSIEKKENTPVFAETKANWINYGDDNLYPSYLIDLMNKSSKHNSLIKKKVNMIAGAGFVPNAVLSDFVQNIHGDEDMEDISFKLAYDLVTYGGFSMAITWDNERKGIARKTFIDHSKVRLAKMLVEAKDEPIKGMYKMQQDGVDFFYTCSDWKQYRKEKHTPELWQGFHESYRSNPTQLISVNEYRAGVDFYTYPDYISAVDWIELDKEIANFHLSSVHNGFTPSMIISFKGGVPTEEAQKDTKKKLKKQYGGSDNASEVFVTFSKNAESAPEFIPINLNASDDRFIQLEEQIQANIIIAHGASPIVAGVAVAGKMGSSAEVIESEEMFQHNVIDAKQSIIERQFNRLLNVSGINEKIELRGIQSFVEEDAEVEEGVVVDVEADAKANLRGSVSGVNGILDIASQVSAGTVSVEAGKSILEIIFGLSPADSNRILNGTKIVTDANE